MRVEAAVLVAAQALLFFLPHILDARGFLTPFVSPFNNGSCDNAVCGEGTCEASNDSILGLISGYTCKCNPGWTKLVGDIQFLPCVIPNCTTNVSCSNDGTDPMPSPSSAVSNPSIFDRTTNVSCSNDGTDPMPSPSSAVSNPSIFDPCLWAMCGGGECVKTSAISHHCDCKPGYYNLMNTSIFPCFRECSLSADCSQLGIRLPGSTASSLPNIPSSAHSSKVVSATPDYLPWLMIHLILLELVWIRL